MSRFYRKYILLLILTIFSSCGLKIQNEIGENVLIGSWRLDHISCFNAEDEDTVYEKYRFQANNHDVLITFEGRQVYYEVDSSCTTSTYGSYVTDFDGDSKGYIDFKNVISGSSCSISINDDGVNSVGTVSVNMTLIPSKAIDLFWLVDEDSLELEVGTGFMGSPQNPGCQGLCFCKGYFEKD